LFHYLPGNISGSPFFGVLSESFSPRQSRLQANQNSEKKQPLKTESFVESESYRITARSDTKGNTSFIKLGLMHPTALAETPLLKTDFIRRYFLPYI
jgi:hypothetical protein